MQLEPKSSGTFIINGFAYHQGMAKEKLVITAVIGSNSKTSRRAFDVSMIANVAAPLLDFSERTLEFHHSYVKVGAGEKPGAFLPLCNLLM